MTEADDARDHNESATERGPFWSHKQYAELGLLLAEVEDDDEAYSLLDEICNRVEESAKLDSEAYGDLAGEVFFHARNATGETQSLARATLSEMARRRRSLSWQRRLKMPDEAGQMPEGLNEDERKAWTRLHLPGLLNVQPCEVWPWAEKVADLRAELAQANSHWKADLRCAETARQEALEACRKYVAESNRLKAKLGRAERMLQEAGPYCPTGLQQNIDALADLSPADEREQA